MVSSGTQASNLRGTHMKLRRPSPALVISCLSLAVACAGTAYAATIITSSSQIKNGVITGSDIKNGSLSSGDLKKGTITESRLSSGVVRKLGGSGGGGAVTRGGGATTAYHAARRSGPEGQPANVMVKVASLTVPAGAYTVTASTVMTALIGPQGPLDALVQKAGALGGRCKLDAAGDATEALQNVVVNHQQTPATLFMQTTRTVGAPAEFALECAAGVAFRLSETSIIATPVSNIALTSLP